jgi:hypothetical protein
MIHYICDLEIVKQTQNEVFLKALDLGNRSITNDAKNVCKKFAHFKRIFYQDSMHEWAELQHEKGVFKKFSPLLDGKIQSIITKFPHINKKDHGKQ